MARFVTAIGIEPGDRVAAIGGGGKMPLLTRLAEEWAGAGGSPLVTTTTKMFHFDPPTSWQLLELREERAESIARLARGSGRPGLVTLVGRVEGRSGRLHGLEERSIDLAASELPADLTLIKADGARGQGLKAHAPHEPAVPANTTLVLAVVGLSAWGKPLSSSTVHRPELFCERWGFAPDEILGDEAYLTALTDDNGYRHRLPLASRYLVFLNQADTPERIEIARRLAKIFEERGVEAIWGDIHTGTLNSPRETKS